MQDDFSRGSEWRRWDLHLHTASSYDYDYKEDDADEVLCQALHNSEVAAVAITDHFVIDKQRIENLRKLASDIVFFPGVELRTDKGDTNIHVILIFLQDINLDNLCESFNVFKREQAKSPEQDERVYWDYNDIVSFAKKHDAIISIHAGSKENGLDKKIVNTLEHNWAVKEDYAKDVHIFEMGKEKDVDGYNQRVFQKISRKPMIICSDNHDPRQYNPKSKLWIKADPTFEWLKQILYEPEERVRISDTKPETKPDYYVIDHVTFNDGDFSSEPIVFNDKLTCIIGGKSTGKSILLHNLALTIDKEQVEKKDIIAHVRTKTDVNLIVSWRDGVNDSEERKIIYIPQTYLNRLVDEKTEKTEIDTIIQDIVLQNADVKKAFENMEAEISKYKQTISKRIMDLLETHRTIKGLDQQKKELGDKGGIEAEIKKLSEEREKLSAELKLSEDEIKEYETTIQQIAKLSEENSAIDSDLSLLSTSETIIEPRPIDDRFSTQTKDILVKHQNTIVTDANNRWNTIKNELLVSLSKTKQDNLAKQADCQKNEAKLKDKIQSNKAISELTKKIRFESEKLARFSHHEEVQKKRNKDKGDLLTEIARSVEFYKEQREKFAHIVNNSQDSTKSNLHCTVEVPFRKIVFVEKLEALLDRSKKDCKDIIVDFTEGNKLHTPDSIKDIARRILSGSLALKKEYSPEVSLREICSNWYEIKYKVTMDNDSIDVMSLGKKALVLLKLLIELAESEYPILIDQPEDDLDNRSIFDELIPFIKKKKKKRQIIIVTHNANIVVGADAEEIIVANQGGNNSPNKQYRFEYRSGAIENNTKPNEENGDEKQGILNERGIQQHICDILEGGEKAFELRKNKYHL